MKFPFMRLLLAAFVLVFPLMINAQAPSRAGSEYTYIYKLTKEDVQWMLTHPWLDDSNWILGKPVDSVHRNKPGNINTHIDTGYGPGHYLLLNTDDLSASASLKINSSFTHIVQETNGEWWVVMKDTIQAIVKPGKLTMIGSGEKDTVFSYDSSCLCYPVPYQKTGRWFLFEAGGEYSYLFVHSSYVKRKFNWKFWKRRRGSGSGSYSGGYVGSRYHRWMYSRWWHKRKVGWVLARKITPMQTNPGYIAINQPEFKHYDTLKMKSFLVNRKGKPKRKALYVKMTGGNYYDKNIVWKKIKPSPRGAYTFEMAIPDSLRIDQNYTLSVCNKRGAEFKSINFKLEDYELKKVFYTWENKQNEYYRGNKIILYAKAVDANNLPLPDATVRVKLRLTSINTSYDSLLVLPDSAFTNWFDTTLNCNPDGLTPIEIPAHLVPNADFSVYVQMEFMNADNQPGSAAGNFNIVASSRKYYLVQDSNGMRAGYLVQGNNVHGMAAKWRVTYGDKIKRVKNITLPYYQNWEPGARMYELLDTNGWTLQTLYMPTTIPNPPKFIAQKTYDSLHVTLDNPLGIEVAWRITYNKKPVTKGSGTQLDFHRYLKGEKAVSIIYSYTWAGNIYTQETVAWVKEKQLTVKIDQPGTTYPGSAIPVEITVTDYKRRAAKGVNLAAYSVNTEFDNIQPPAMPYYGRGFGSTLRKQNLSTTAITTNRSFFITHEIFKRLSLRKNPYYRMMYSGNAIGQVYDSLSNEKTQLSLYVRNKNGHQKGYYALWIDNKLRFYNISSYHVPNAFTVSPGKHKIQVRAEDGMYELDSIECLPGMRTLTGLNTDSVYNNPTIKWTETKGAPDKDERHAYNTANEHLLYIAAKNTRAGIQPYYLRQGDKKYFISNFSQLYTYKNSTYFIVGPFNQGDIEFILPNDTAFTFYFDPNYMYECDRNSVLPTLENYHEPALYGLQSYYAFKDTAVEIPYPKPKSKPVSQTDDTDEPEHYYTPEPGTKKQHKVKHYDTRDPFDHPGIRYYSKSTGHGQRAVFTLNTDEARNLAHIWFINKDSLEYSSIYTAAKNSTVSLGHVNITPGHYDVLMVYHNNSYKLLRNFELKGSNRYYYRPSGDGFMFYDSAILWPYIATVRLLNRGPVPEFYNKPVKVDVKLDSEPAQLSEKIIGNFTVNGYHINNVLLIVEDRMGNFVAAGLTNQYGFYQIPVPPGSYRVKAYTTSWDMFLVDKVSVVTGSSTVADMAVKNYTNKIETSNYNSLSENQRSAPKGKNQPKYTQPVSAHCKGDCGEIRGVLVDPTTNEPLIAATVIIVGTTIGASTDLDGAYRIMNLAPGTYSIEFRYVGYQTKVVQGVVVRPDAITFLNESLPELTLETSTVEIVSMSKPLVKGDALGSTNYYESNSYTSNIDDVMLKSMPGVSSSIESISFRGAHTSGTAYYVDGVRITGEVDTRLIDRKGEGARMLEMQTDPLAMRTRKTFRDYGYWIPNLTTNRKGKAGFTVQLPDNQTQWITFVPAMDKHSRTGLGTSFIKAYKPLTANLSIPRFMVVGDRLELSGKSVNYTDDSVVVNTLLSVNDSDLWRQATGFKNYFISKAYYRPAKAGEDKVHFSIKTGTNYTDGEERTLPILASGLLVSDGESKTLENEAHLTLLPKEGHVNRQVLLSNRRLEMLQAEIDKLRNYRYGCVEQTASKLKALLLEKQFAKSLGKKFDDEKLLRSCIKRLEKYQNDDGAWGWWEHGTANPWMTVYATDALHRAIKAGYSTSAAVKGAAYINNHFPQLDYSTRVEAVILLARMKYGNSTDKIALLEKSNITLQQRYGLMLARQELGQTVNTDTLLKTLRTVSTKEAYWGEQVFSLSVNELQTSAIAYQILRNKGGYDTLLRRVRNYFLSQPPSVRNTIQSATLLQTFIQDIANEEAKHNELIPDISLNGLPVKLPLKKELQDADTLKIDKSGSDLYYLYAWQNFVPNPAPETRYFTITTTLTQEGKTGDVVVAGKPVTLNINLLVEQEREYVMLEVPIPAGFSYVTKKGKENGYEEHREHFDEKVSIFFTRIPRGRYDFTIELLPKFTGEATLLPASAEEMYFPMHRGNNTKRVVTVK